MRSGGNRSETATLGGGCFWCIEAVYERIDGVKEVVSGYAGGPQQAAGRTGRGLSAGRGPVYQFSPSTS